VTVTTIFATDMNDLFRSCVMMRQAGPVLPLAEILSFYSDSIQLRCSSVSECVLQMQAVLCQFLWPVFKPSHKLTACIFLFCVWVSRRVSIDDCLYLDKHEGISYLTEIPV
jgi:hypothetical protein